MSAETNPRAQFAQSASIIDQTVAHLLSYCEPGVAIGASLDGVPIYRSARGLASMDSAAMLTPNTRMRIASTSKHFTALAWLLLCEDGRAHLDEPIKSILPELGDMAGGVTARQLLTHTSGLRDTHDIIWSLRGSELRTASDTFINLYSVLRARNFEPNTSWIYNNGGYLIVSKAIERISGKPLETFFRERVFDPIGMLDTQLRRWESDFVSNSAVLHMAKVGGGFWKFHNGSELLGEGGIVSTVDDMLRWLQHMDHPTIGTAETWAAIKTAHILDNGASTFYGLGLFVDSYRGQPTIHHAGGLLGGNSYMVKLPSVGLDIVALSNRSDVSAAQLVFDIIDRVVPNLSPVTTTTAVCGSGTYVSDDSGRVIQLSERDGQQFVAIDGFEMPFAEGDDDRLLPSGIMRYFKMALTRSGSPARPDRVHLHEFGAVDIFKRAEFPITAQRAPTIGTYVDPETGFRATISVTDDGSKLEMDTTTTRVMFNLSQVADRTWRTMSETPLPFGGIVREADDGQVLYYTTGRNRDLRYERDQRSV